ncbi:predicted protein [Sclerotinia sclerotiorum 1980 UF-70]|uniref:Uncharacterized protein n=1 Tax=Sclerotinia sclerotiorum (strain ATCC 18683 / 1980 / Ss-1) TaxID=665079 RepID=A7F4S0_SCLS1|nr:predicted protein [Sclerotinia sclerotiorum 1980 UF-70]EDN97741.1 predicted protein [Sclerotinia sclerotiorum 1980 UF-70]
MDGSIALDLMVWMAFLFYGWTGAGCIENSGLVYAIAWAVSEYIIYRKYGEMEWVVGGKRDGR